MLDTKYILARAEAAVTFHAERDEARAEVERLTGALTKINAIRDSIVGAQTINWSEHVYPLVAALNEAGFEGTSYHVAREHVGTLIERIKVAESERDEARAEVERLQADRDEARADCDDLTRDPMKLSYQRYAEFERLKRADVNQGRRIAELLAQLAAVTKERDEALRQRDEARAAGEFLWRHQVANETAEAIATWLDVVSEGFPVDDLKNIARNIRAGGWRTK